MHNSHSLARVLVGSGVALLTLIAVAASAAAITEPPPAHTDWNAITETANQQFTFN